MVDSVAQSLEIDTDRFLTYNNNIIEYQKARITKNTGIKLKITNERIRKVDEVTGLGPDIISLFKDMVDDCQVHIEAQNSAEAKDTVKAYKFSELLARLKSMDRGEKITKLVIYSRLEINEHNRNEYTKVFKVVKAIESNDNVVSCIGDMSELFAGSCIKTIKGKWDMSKVTNMNGMFDNAEQFRGDGISGWDTANVEDMSWTFHDTIAFNGDISAWNTKKVIDMTGMFHGATAFNRPLNWDTGKVKRMPGMFRKAVIFNGDISSWNTSNVVDMTEMFLGAKEFNQVLKTWATQLVTRMAGMFREAEKFNSDISGWNTSRIFDMSEMFWGAKSFNMDISTRDTKEGTFWNTGEVKYMHDMFRGATAFNKPLNWDMKNVTDMSGMFREAEKFNSDISGWNTSQIFDMSEMFWGAKSFNRDISTRVTEGGTFWNTVEVKYTKNMFRGATAFNKPLNWDMKNVTDMSGMFCEATVFNQDISTWNIPNGTNTDLIFEGAGSLEPKHKPFIGKLYNAK